LADIKSFDRSKAEAEVKKFLLDREMLNLFIEFQKRKEEDPDFKVPAEEKEGFFSTQNIILLYGGYLAASSGPKMFREWVAGQEAAGDWSGTHIPFIDEWLAAGTGATDSAIQAVADSVQASSGL
jgi:hypothetical protein